MSSFGRFFRVIRIALLRVYRSWRRRTSREPIPIEADSSPVVVQEEPARVLSSPLQLTAQDVADAYERAGYKLFRGELNLNIFGIRTGLKAGEWDDFIGILYQEESWRKTLEEDGSEWNLLLFDGTTDPSDVWLRRGNPAKGGTAIVELGQYLSCWTRGLHASKYPALVQRGAPNPITVIRDGNLDSELDVDSEEKVLDTGWHGINCHRSSSNTEIELETVGEYSAGCIVIQKATDWNTFMYLVDKSAEKYGETFSFTLFRWDQEAELHPLTP